MNHTSMHFDPNNPIIQLCLRGMGEEAWNEATNDFERFIAAYFMAQQQERTEERLKWFETARQYVLKLNDPNIDSVFPAIYSNMAKCYEALAHSYTGNPSDPGPFYHGTRADLKVGDLLMPGEFSNYKDELRMNHIYFTALVNTAGLAAALAKGEGQERVYTVKPTGTFENDPNVTDKKFPGNLTRSYRSVDPLQIIEEVTDWVKQTPEQIQMWREKLASNKGEIIN